MDTFSVIFLFVVASIFILLTINALYGGGYFIAREDWDDDYRRLGKTTFKSRIKVILLALLINIIFISLCYILGNNPLSYLLSLAYFLLLTSRGPGDLFENQI